jgi:hypothetical protein
MIGRTGLAFCVVLATNAQASDEGRALANLADEYATCHVYFSIGAEGVRKMGDSRLADELQATALLSLRLAVASSNFDVTKARLQLASQTLFDEIKRDYSNMAILNAKYGEACKQAVIDPDVRLKYWRDK